MLEDGLLDAVAELARRNRIFDRPPTLEEILDPVEEQVLRESPYTFEDGDAGIVAEVRREEAITKGEIIEVDSDSEDEEKVPDMSKADISNLCLQLEKVSLTSDMEGSLDLA